MEITCQRVDETYVICNGTKFFPEEIYLTYADLWFWIYIAIYSSLTLGAGLFAGLNMGLLSLDLMSLTVLAEGGSEKESKYARRLIPLVKRHHLLIVTLVLANSCCVEAMPLFMEQVVDPIIALVISISAVVFFGDIAPQALCTRFGLAIGYYFVPLVYFLMVVMLPVAWPIAKLLDCTLGHSHDYYYKRGELKALVALHGPRLRSNGEGMVVPSRRNSISSNCDSASQKEVVQPSNNVLTKNEAVIIRGALELTMKTAKNATMPLSEVFMIPSSTVLDQSMLMTICENAHSRVPVFNGDNRHDIQGILLTKMLVGIDPRSEITVSELIKRDPRVFREIPYILECMPLYDVLNKFFKLKTHIAVVGKYEQEQIDFLSSISFLSQSSGPHEFSPKVQGIVTMEDVLEQLMLRPIVDEADLIRQRAKRLPMRRRGLAGVDRRLTTGPEAILSDVLINEIGLGVEHSASAVVLQSESEHSNPTVGVISSTILSRVGPDNPYTRFT